MSLRKNSSWCRRNLLVWPRSLLIQKLGEVVEVSNQGITKGLGAWHISKLECGIVVECEVLVISISEEFLAWDIENLETKTTGGVGSVCHDNERQRGIPHNDIVDTRFLEHALCQIIR